PSELPAPELLPLLALPAALASPALLPVLLLPALALPASALPASDESPPEEQAARASSSDAPTASPVRRRRCVDRIIGAHCPFVWHPSGIPVWCAFLGWG